MNSRRFASALRVLGWMAFYLLFPRPLSFSPAQTAAAGFVIRHARVFDGHKVLEQADVWVENGKIKAVGKT